MYFWKIDRLKHELRQGTSPRQSLHYLLGLLLAPLVLSLAFTSIGLAVMAVVPPSQYPDPPTPGQLMQVAQRHLLWDGVGLLALATTYVVGLRYCYRQNGGDGGHQFLPRMTALALVTVVRVHVLFAVPAWIFVRVMVQGWNGAAPSTTWEFEVYQVVVAAAVLWRVGRHLGDLRAVGVDAMAARSS